MLNDRSEKRYWYEPTAREDSRRAVEWNSADIHASSRINGQDLSTKLCPCESKLQKKSEWASQRNSTDMISSSRRKAMYLKESSADMNATQEETKRTCQRNSAGINPSSRINPKRRSTTSCTYELATRVSHSWHIQYMAVPFWTHTKARTYGTWRILKNMSQKRCRYNLKPQKKSQGPLTETPPT